MDMDAYGSYQQTNQYYGSAVSHEEDTSLRSQVDQLQAEVERLKTELQQYKTVSQSFEKRVLDLHLELMKKDEEILHLKEQQSVALKETDPNAEEADSEILRKLFVGGLNFSTTDEILKQYFSEFGTVTDAIVMKDPTTKKSRGFGFVVFATTVMLDAAQAARPHQVDGREVETKRAMPRGEAAKKPGILAKKIFIGGLKTTTEESALKEYFAQFGTVDNVDVLEDKNTKRKRGFAYVTFTDSDPVDKAVLQKYHTIDGRRCEVKKAFTREEMKNKNAYGGAPTSPQFGMGGNFGPGRNNMGGNCGPGGNMGGNFGPGGNMGGNFGPGGNMGGNFGPGGNMGGNFGPGGNFGGPGGNVGGGNCGHGGNFGPGGVRGGNMDGSCGLGGWGPGNNAGGYGGAGNFGGDGAGSGGNMGSGWNQGNWNQGGTGYGETGQGMGNNSWNSGGTYAGAGAKGGSGGKPIRNSYTQRAAGPYGGGYGVSANPEAAPSQDATAVRN